MEKKKVKLTSFKVTATAKRMEEEIVRQLDISKASFHRRMIDYYLGSNPNVDDRLLIRNHSCSDYIIKSEKEQIYLDQEREEKLRELAKKLTQEKKQDVTITILLFQALVSYLAVVYPVVIGDEEN